MTRKEQIKGLYALKEYLTKNPIELDGHKSLPITLIDYAIEALEQELILDKIRAEIEKQKTTMNMFNREDTKQYAIAMEDVLKIIDKYKAESENT